MGVDFDECFRHEYPRLVGLGTAMSGSAEVARELAQETMMRAHARWDEVSAYEQPGAWLRRVMSNLLIDHHRSAEAERVAHERLQRAPASSVASVASEPGDDWEWLVGPLPPRQRVIVTLYYAEDRSVDEIASMLDIAPGTVKSALGKARARLLEAISEEGGHGRAN